ncbi:MAG: NAD(P)-binding domain-containing protein, partial [Myxococcales bacterium]
MHATDVAVIGAGPYGLSCAAQLKARGIDFRIFGQPMIFWERMLPKINLKSPDFGTNIYTPEPGNTFVEWCREKGHSRREPIPMSRFTEYGLDVQRRLLPMVETAQVARVEREGDGFGVSLGNGTRFRARKVVCAVGLGYFADIPKTLSRFPNYFVSHTCDHSNYSGWDGKEVIVLGGGQSALEAAAALHEARAHVQIAVRAPDVYFASPPSEGPRPLKERLKTPASVLGPGWLNFTLQRAPLWPHLLADARRVRLTRNHLGPWGAWWVRERVEGRVPVLGDVEIASAREDCSRLRVRLRQRDGRAREIAVDHVVCGTGYSADVSRLPFLSSDLVHDIRRIERAPRLSRK